MRHQSEECSFSKTKALFIQIDEWKNYWLRLTRSCQTQKGKYLQSTTTASSGHAF